ncbi:MAG: hypothetical protein JKY32_10570 [Rhizobiales bacterium]|nr:hypothetical protein [Hyphomicrobiales bacterium]
MNPFDIDQLVHHWKKRGFKLDHSGNNKSIKSDMVAHASFSDMSETECDWQDISDEELARFTGRKSRVTRPRIQSSVPMQTLRPTHTAVEELLFTPQD